MLLAFLLVSAEEVVFHKGLSLIFYYGFNAWVSISDLLFSPMMSFHPILPQEDCLSILVAASSEEGSQMNRPIWGLFVLKRLPWKFSWLFIATCHLWLSPLRTIICRHPPSLRMRNYLFSFLNFGRIRNYNLRVTHKLKNNVLDRSSLWADLTHYSLIWKCVI